MRFFERHFLIASIAFAGLLTVNSIVIAQEFQTSKEQLSGLYTGKAYSPYAQRTFPERPLWGDNHLHTALSFVLP